MTIWDLVFLTKHCDWLLIFYIAQKFIDPLIYAAVYKSVLSVLNLSTVVFEINIDIWSFALNGDPCGIVKHKWYSHIIVNVLMRLNLHCQNDAHQYQVTKISSYTST